MFKVIIAGGRDFTDYDLLKTTVTKLVAKYEAKDITIVSGTARGADQMGERLAKEMGWNVEEYPAKWDLYGKSAGYKRNELMAQNAHGVIAFWDGKSRGTEHMINIARKQSLHLHIEKY